MKRLLILVCGMHAALYAQEANSGFDLAAVASASTSYQEQATAGFRAILYPTWKLNRHWAVSGAVQVHSRPYFFYELCTPGYGVKTDVLQANLSYSQFWKNASLVVRAGQLTTAFGSFLLHYDDSKNPLTDMPLSYGYYGKPVSPLGFTGAQVDVTSGKLDLRAQFVNSSPANRRSIFSHDQYGTWAGGAGYTLWQGFRVGASTYRGPYLHRQHPYFFRGEANPKDLPASAYGVDVQWGRGPWNVAGEYQRFVMDYRAIPVFRVHAGYAEVRRVLNPRWFVATRVGYLRASAYPGREAYEMAAGFRPSRGQLLKIGYQRQQGPTVGTQANTVTVQYVTTLSLVSLARN